MSKKEDLFENYWKRYKKKTMNKDEVRCLWNLAYNLGKDSNVSELLKCIENLLTPSQAIGNE